jgi:hypothetical protein
VVFGAVPGACGPGWGFGVTEKRQRPGGHSGEHPWRQDPGLSSRPPFEEGNFAGLRSGANSERKLAPIAKRLEEEISVIAPWCARPAFAAAVRAWAWAEAACELYREWYAEVGLRDGEGQPVTGLQNWDRCESRAAKLRSQLSIDPSALAGLVNKLASASAAGGAHARAEITALQREVKALDAQIAETLDRKELGR